ncbi:unnamed protein product, partial [Closterium sp. NIES-54]
CVSLSLQEAIQVVPSNVVADIVAGGEAAHVAFDCLLGCKLVAFCIWPGEMSDKKASNAGMLLLLRLDHLGWLHGRVCIFYGSDSVHCDRSGKLEDPSRLVDLDISSWKAPCGPLACVYAFDRVLNDLDAVVGHDPAPRIAKPIARNDLLAQFEKNLNNRVEVTSTDQVTQFLGLNISYAADAIHLSACKYAETLSAKFNIPPANLSTPYCNPATPHHPDTTPLNPSGHQLYQQQLGCLLFAAVMCRPDLSYISSQLAQYAKRPEGEHMLDLQRAL